MNAHANPLTSAILACLEALGSLGMETKIVA